MMLPTVHLNGTSKAELMRQFGGAIDAIRTAQDAIGDASPNARDYYVQGENAFSRACAEHRARASRLADIRREYESILDAIDAR